MAEYIEREAAIAAAFSATSLGNSAFRDVYDTVNRLHLIPAADVRPTRHGRWLKTDDFSDEQIDWVSCGICKAKIPDFDYPYCPNCGAKMDGDVNGGTDNR